jgi:uncharacterized SAM-binding protein YcdF (DUF218 family)
MFNLASKVLFLFIDPPALILILLVIAWIARRRFTRIFPGTLAATLLLFYLLACPKASEWLVSTLEDQYRDNGIANAPAAPAIVVLGGALNMPSGSHSLAEITSSSDRLLEALRLYRVGKAPLIVASSGDNPLLSKAGNMHNAEAMRSILEEWGAPSSAILVEDASINTRENALFTRSLLEQRGIGRVLLVTSAIHMPRAASAFRKVGFDVFPVPGDFLTGWEEQRALFNWFPSSTAMANSRDAIHEWLGLWVYRLRGWS